MLALSFAATPPSPASQPSPLLPSKVKKSSSSTLDQLPLSPINRKTLTLIHNSGVIACLRANTAEVAFEAASVALAAGISVLEIVVSTPGVFQVLQQLAENHTTVALGVGTVLNADDAINAKRSGAKFFMSPAMTRGILGSLKDDGILCIPGAMTPTEILSAHDAGAQIVKVYPVSALGGTQYISALKKPFSHISMVASQGIKIDSVGDYINSGASSVVLSDAIFDKEAMDQKNFNMIYQLAHRASLQGKEAVRRKKSCTST